jgi:SprT protein
MSLASRKSEIEAKVKALVSKIESVFGIKVPAITVKFDLRGAAAGWARVSKSGEYSLRFNTDMMVNESWDHLFNDTVPHEVAHLIGYRMGHGMNHGREWRSLCIRLGGSGKRCHDEKVVYAKGSTFEYKTTTGRAVILSQIRHNRVQRQGEVYRWRDGSKIDSTCTFKKVA